jgi:hypothetical protein
MADSRSATLALTRALLWAEFPSSESEWRTTAEAARCFGVLEGFRARAGAALGDAPQDVRALLDDARAEAAMGAALSLRCAAAVCAATSEAVVVKGGALLATGVIAPGDRYATDVDILTTHAGAAATTRALADYGLRLVPSIRHDGRTRSSVEWPGGIWRSDDGVVVDFHVVARLPRETLLTDSELGAIRTPTMMATAIGLCRHVEQHHLDARHALLRHALDLDALRNRMGAAQWNIAVRDRHVRRSLAAVERLALAARRGDFEAVGAQLSGGRHASVALRLHHAARRAFQFAIHERALLPWLLFPHPRYLKASRHAAQPLAKAYAQRLFGR